MSHRVLIIGLGSIGKRHLGLIIKLYLMFFPLRITTPKGINCALINWD